MRQALFVSLLCGLAACDRLKPPAPVAPTPAPTPEAGFAGVPSAPPVAMVQAPAEVNLDAANAETQLVKSQVLSRIDVIPDLSPEEKDKLYVQVDRARSMGKIITIPFSSGQAAIGPPEVAAMAEKITLPQIQKFADDPTVVLIVLGFADKKGDAKQNRSISLQRANSVVRALKERCGVMNVTHAVGMGGSEMFDAQNLNKNRVVEVWAVQP
ncbi:MAG: OmpA family protein [Verrucomicrobiota bacterium]